VGEYLFPLSSFYESEEIVESIKEEDIKLITNVMRNAALAKPYENKIVTPKVSVELPSDAAVICILIPNFLGVGEVRSEAERLSHNYGKGEYIQELAEVHAKMGKRSAIYLLRMDDYKDIIDSIPRNSNILNLCDGSDIEGVPGPCISKYLEDTKRNYYGCSASFQTITSSKIEMKRKFFQQGVSTSKFACVTKDKPLIRDAVKDMRYPLLMVYLGILMEALV